MTETNTEIKTPARLSRRKKIVRWAAAGMVLLALAVGLPSLLHSLSHESTDDAFIDGDIVPISPRVNGHVSGIHVKDNQWVKAGDLLVELDPRDFEAHLDAAKAALAAAKASDKARNIAVELTTITATAGLNEAKDSRVAAKAAVREATARLQLAKAALAQVQAEADSAGVRHRLDATDLKRYRQMAKTKTVTPQDLDHAAAAEQISAAALTAAKKKADTQEAKVQEATASLQAAKANLRQAEARLDGAKAAPHRISQSRSQAEVSHAEIEKAMAEVAQARLNLSYTKIYAPCDGFVTKKGGEVGQFVQAGESLLALVSRAVWVDANFKETQLTRMRPGQPAVIKVDAYPDLTFRGHVDSIQHGSGARFSLLPPENATGNYVKVVQRVPVKIVFDNSQATAKVLLAPGMSVVPDVEVGARGWPNGVPPQAPPASKAEPKGAAGR
ncbi:MAG: HlyD family secretion protein [Deltaproteobacteria bacterium]